MRLCNVDGHLEGEVCGLTDAVQFQHEPCSPFPFASRKSDVLGHVVERRREDRAEWTQPAKLDRLPLNLHDDTSNHLVVRSTQPVRVRHQLL